APYSITFFTHNARSDLTRFDRNRLINHPLLFGVVAHFHMAGNREIFAEGMTNETVVGKNAAKVGVTFEDDAVKIEGFALVPVHSWPDIDQGGQHREFVVFDI